MHGQAITGSIRGQVADPSGAVIPNAQITVLSASGQTVATTTSTASGAYEVHGLNAGNYTIKATAQGFALYVSKPFFVGSGQTKQRDVAMQIQSDQQQVVVSDETTTVSTEASNNASAIVIKGKDLDALSDDPDEMQDELNALAGPAAGPNGGQIYIDGFSGGQMPPKSAIREIRVNQNPFSSEYDKLGYGRIEILTKPGTDKFHGFIMATGNNASFNSRSPFLTVTPEYYSYGLHGNAGGSLNKTSSWFVSAFRRSNQDVAVINATQSQDAQGNSIWFRQAVPKTQSRIDINPRFDFQFGQSNTLTVRYGFNRSTAENNGVGQQQLQSQAYNTESMENEIQISDTQILSPRFVNETRFEYSRERSKQTALDHTPTITVTGAFTGGGNNSGDSRSNQDFFELHNFTTGALGSHSIRFGTRLRLNRQASYSNSGANGSYTYDSLLNYLKDHAAGNFAQASQYQITQINKATIRTTIFDGALYAGDEWHIKPTFTLNYGIRYENQNHLSSNFNIAPRLSIAWMLDGNGKKPAKTVLRVGYGWFYDRLSANNVLQTEKWNGYNQVTKIVSTKNPSPKSVIYTIDKDFQSPISMQAAVSLERQIGKSTTSSVTYINSRGVHQQYSNNISFVNNGPNTTLNNYQYESGGIFKQNQVIVNINSRNKHFTTFGFYMFNHADGTTSGFPSIPSKPTADYGRATFSVAHRFVLGGNVPLPYKISLSPFMAANSGSPYNITVSDDLNGDNQFNDRPSFTDCSSSNAYHYETGPLATYQGHCFNVNPGTNDARIPINYGTGPNQFSVNLRVSKAIGFGPKVTGGNAGGGGGMGGPGGPGGGGGRRMGGGMGPGGLTGSGGPPRLDANVPRRYNLTLIASGRNIFNMVNLAQPIGVVNRTTFGQSTALAGGFFNASSSANRAIDLQMNFSF